jgi:hypothetical protein
MPKIDLLFSQENVTYNTENLNYLGSRQDLVIKVYDRSYSHDIQISSH